MPDHVPYSWNLIIRLEAQSARCYLKLPKNWKYEIAPQNSFRWSKNKLKTSLPALRSATEWSFLSWCGRWFGGKNYQKAYLLDWGPATLRDCDQTAKIRKLAKLIIQTEDLTSTAVCSFQVSETIIFVSECWCWTTLSGENYQIKAPLSQYGKITLLAIYDTDIQTKELVKKMLVAFVLFFWSIIFSKIKQWSHV